MDEATRIGLEACLKLAGDDVVHCCEGGGPEDLVGSLALTIGRLSNRLRAQTADTPHDGALGPGLRAVVDAGGAVVEQCLHTPSGCRFHVCLVTGMEEGVVRLLATRIERGAQQLIDAYAAERTNAKITVTG